MQDHIADLTAIAFVMAIAATFGVVLMRFRQPPIVGYILTGVVLGPTGLGLVENTGNVTVLAELGVILLLFLVGMELSVRVFVRVARVSALVVAGQVAASLGLVALFGLAFGWGAREIVVVAFIVAISSTAIAMQMLEEIGELRRTTGRITVGVLIAQDIAVVPMLIAITSLGGAGDVRAGAIRLVVAAVLIVAFLRYLGSRPGKLRLPFTDQIRGRVDLVALASLAFCFAAAAASGLLGLSAAFGAFLAGLLIAGSTLRSEVIAATHPIQSLLLVVFFLSIGLLIDLRFVVANLGTVIVFVLGVLAAKTVLNVVLLRLVGQPWEQAFPGGLIMAPIGEFSFVLAATGFSDGAITADTYRLAIAVIAVSLLVSPLWMVSVRRGRAVAHAGISDFRTALGEIYAGEIEATERGRAFVMRGAAFISRRVRAMRVVWQRRRRRKLRAAGRETPPPAAPPPDGGTPEA